MSTVRGMAWTVVSVVALVLVLWNCEGSKAEGAAGSQAGISNSSDRGTGCGAHRDRGGAMSQEERCVDESRSGGNRRKRCERNRFEEGQGRKSCGAAKRRRERRKRRASELLDGKGIGRKQRAGGRLCESRGTIVVNRENGSSIREPRITIERVDDVPLLIKMMVGMGLQQVMDNHIPEHWKQRSLSWGWTAVIWLAYILSEGDHRKVVVREFVREMKITLESITGQKVDELDFTDDRLAILLKYLSDREYWIRIEEELGKNTISAYKLSKDTARCDATTVSKYHKTAEGGLFQFGNSKDDPNRPQLKIMMGSLDPLGMPLATDVVSGNRSDDELYAPIISRMSNILNREGVLYVGDCKMGSFGNRLHIKSAEIQGHYLCPLPQTGEVAKNMMEWIEKGILLDADNTLIKFTVVDDKGIEETKAKGYEIVSMRSGTVDGKEIVWEERLLIVNSPKYAEAQARGLERRIQNAITKILALTPAKGRGKKQITNEADLLESVEAILKQQAVSGMLTYEYIKEVEKQEKYVGRGRGSADREKQITEKVRYVVTSVVRQTDAIESEVQKFGWKVYATDVSSSRLSFVDAMKCYRNEYRIERIFNRLKSRYVISPLYVKRDDQAEGLANLLTLGVRVATLIQYVARRSLEKSGDSLTGLHLENPKKATSIPTCERLLRAFSKINLTIIETGDCIIRQITPLSHLQIKILELLGMDASIYSDIAKLTKPLRC